MVPFGLSNCSEGNALVLILLKIHDFFKEGNIEIHINSLKEKNKGVRLRFERILVGLQKTYPFLTKE